MSARLVTIRGPKIKLADVKTALATVGITNPTVLTAGAFATLRFSADDSLTDQAITDLVSPYGYVII